MLSILAFHLHNVSSNFISGSLRLGSCKINSHVECKNGAIDLVLSLNFIMSVKCCLNFFFTYIFNMLIEFRAQFKMKTVYLSSNDRRLQYKTIL